MILWISLLLACRPGDPGTVPGGVGGGPPTVPMLDVRIETEPGLRDLVMIADGVREVRWYEDGLRVSEVVGVRVPAHLLWPGASWRVEVVGIDGLGGVAEYTVPEPPGGNVLVLLLDDVGVDKVSSYGRPESPPTPVLDGLAAEGVRFTRAYASMVCSPTRGSLMTGRHPRRTGLGWIVDVGARDFKLPLASRTVPEVLEEARNEQSYSHSAAGKWHMAGRNAEGYLSHPLDQGFDWFAGRAGNPPYPQGTGYYHWEKNNNGVLEDSTTYMTTDTTNDAIERIAVMPEPWFMYVAYNAVHTPLEPPPDDLVSTPTDPEAEDHVLYDAMLEALETEIARLLDSLDPDTRARTTIVVVGDNGTHDHGIDPAINTYRNKHTAYEGGVHVPMIVAGPHVANPGSTSDALVHVVDILPTVADIAGVPLGGEEGQRLDFGPEDGVDLDGRSLLPHLADPGLLGRWVIYAEGFNPPGGPADFNINRRALREDEWKLVRLGTATDELFRLEPPFELDTEDLLLDDALEPDAAEAYERLAAEMDRLETDLVFEGF